MTAHGRTTVTLAFVELRIDGIANGGDGVGRLPDGRVVFVRAGLPGDVVRVEIVATKKRFANARIVELVSPGDGRTEPGCRHVAEGCGGCDVQHATLERQRELKVDIVLDAMERIGRFDSPHVVFGGGVEGHGYRTTVRCAVVDGKAGFREFKSARAVAAPDCTIAHPRIRDLMARGDFGAADDVLIRVGSRTGDANVVVSPTADGVSVDGADVIGADELAAGAAVSLEEEAAGHRWRISAQSFFQSGPEAAELLVQVVGGYVGAVTSDQTVCDLYSGVGLFSGTVAGSGRVVAVEGNRWAVADAGVNLAGRDVSLVRSSVEQWHPCAADVVVADPPRDGLRSAGAEVVAGTGANRVVLVSCDPAAFGRDARLLVDAGYSVEDVSVLDLFPQTSHVEVVGWFERL